MDLPQGPIGQRRSLFCALTIKCFQIAFVTQQTLCLLSDRAQCFDHSFADGWLKDTIALAIELVLYRLRRHTRYGRIDLNEVRHAGLFG